jgi:hypothetical protein
MIPQSQCVVKSKYRSIVKTSADIPMVDEPYFHNYLFPHNEKRCYRNKLTLGLEGVIYLGVTLKDKRDRHWKVEVSKATIVPKPLPKPKKMYWLYIVNGSARYYHNEKKLTDFDLAGKSVQYMGIRFSIKTVKTWVENSKLIQEFKQLHPNNRFCCYCGVELNEAIVSREHVIPKSKGGKGYSLSCENIKPCCRDCNTEKGNLTLREYIGTLNIIFANMKPNDSGYTLTQTKIINANKIAIELNSIN